MNKCKECKYFIRHTDEYKWNKYGDCKCNSIIYGNTRKNDIEVWDSEKRMTDNVLQETDLLLYMDYENYSAFCEVGEDFGCIHYEERKNKNV